MLRDRRRGIHGLTPAKGGDHQAAALLSSFGEKPLAIFDEEFLDNICSERLQL